MKMQGHGRMFTPFVSEIFIENLVVLNDSTM